MVHLLVEADHKAWLNWATNHQLANEVLAFIHVMPHRLTADPVSISHDHAIVPSPRSWERVLRNYLYRRIGKHKEIDYSRPTRRWLGLEYEMHQHEGVALPFEPDRSRPSKGDELLLPLILLVRLMMRSLPQRSLLLWRLPVLKCCW